MRRANAGRDPFPLFLKRGKVYKKIDSYLHVDAPTTHTTQLIDRTGRVDPQTMQVRAKHSLRLEGGSGLPWAYKLYTISSHLVD